MLPSKRAVDFAVAGAMLLLALAISPIGIRFATERLDLSPRINVLSLTFVAFLLILAGAVVVRGRSRQVLFHLLAWSFALTTIAAIEVGAVTFHLADRIAPLEDTTILIHGNQWPPHLMSNARMVNRDGMTLYRPWRGDGILINELGLRTAPPTPKRVGEWRIAVTGGSAAWGWRVLDVDTIAAQLQQALHRQGHPNIVVYNFGKEAAAIADELSLLQRFRDLYSIDQVVFYTGGNDATYRYMNAAAPPSRLGGLLGGANAFELIKAAHRLSATFRDPATGFLARMDDEVMAQLARTNSLRDGITAADAYCRTTMVRCDFVLQPMLLTRRTPIGLEIAMARTLKQLYPRYDAAIATMYRSAQELGPTVHNLSDVFDGLAAPVFVDVVHTNEAGYRLAATRIATIMASGLH